jgi:hypothetical protein
VEVVTRKQHRLNFFLNEGRQVRFSPKPGIFLEPAHRGSGSKVIGSNNLRKRNGGSTGQSEPDQCQLRLLAHPELQKNSYIGDLFDEIGASLLAEMKLQQIAITIESLLKDE